jgi:hypothetical protein
MRDDRDNLWKIDDLYEQEINLSPNPADLLYQEQQSSWEDIEFEPVDVDEEKLAALVDAATQFHYIYLSELLIMGDLLWNAPDMGTKRLATVLSASRMRDVDAWGRYIAHLQLIRPSISSPLQTYFRKLYEEENQLARLMGLLFVDVFRKELADELQDVEDPTFRRLMQRDAAEGSKNVKVTKEHLQRVSGMLDGAARREAASRVDEYITVIENIAADRETTLNALDVETTTFLGHWHDIIEDYRDMVQDD